MNYLIDGHNLIGKMHDIQLSDPDDEAKLILRLLNWAAVGGNRRVIVVFDGGVPGMNWGNLRIEHLRVIFVPQGKTADDWLIRFMKNQVKNPQEFHLITSDNQIIKQAENKRIKVTKSDQFADEMEAERKGFSELGQERVERTPQPKMKEQEVEAWLQMFGGEKQVELKPYQRRAPKPKPEPTDEAAKAPVSTNPDDIVLAEDEVSEWLALFGGEPDVIRMDDVSAESKSTPGRSKIRREIPPERKAPPVAKDSKLSQDDADLFHSLFGDE